MVTQSDHRSSQVTVDFFHVQPRRQSFPDLNFLSCLNVHPALSPVASLITDHHSESHLLLTFILTTDNSTNLLYVQGDSKGCVFVCIYVVK